MYQYNFLSYSGGGGGGGGGVVGATSVTIIAFMCFSCHGCVHAHSYYSLSLCHSLYAVRRTLGRPDELEEIERLNQSHSEKK